MGADRAAAEGEMAEPAIARVVRAVTQPAGMNIDWRMVHEAGTIIAGISAVLRGKGRRWQHIHSFGVGLGIAGAVAARLKSKYVLAVEKK